MADGKSTYEVQIKTAADLKAAEAYKKSIEQNIKASKDAGKAFDELSRRLDGVDKSLNSTSARAIRITDAMGKVGTAAKNLSRDTAAINNLGNASAFSLGGGGLLGLLKGGVGQLSAITGATFSLVGAFRAASSAISDYADSEDKLNKVQVALASVGKYSRETTDALAEMSGQFENQTNISDGTWLDALTKLIQYGGNTEEIGKLGNTLKNLAGIMDGDVSAATNLMVRALNGNYREFAKFGLQIDKNASQLENWRSFVEQTERGQGILEKRTETLGGQATRLGVAVGNVTKSFGQSVAEGLNFKGILGLLADGVTRFANVIGFTIPHVDDLKNAQNALQRSLEDVGESTQQQTERLKAMSDAADRTAKKVEAAKNAIRQLQQLGDDEATSKMNFELALVDDEEARTGNKLGASRRRASIRQRYAREKNARADQSDIAQIAMDQRLFSELSGQRASFDSRESALKKAIAGAVALQKVFTDKSTAEDAVRIAKDKLSDAERATGGSLAAVYGGGMSSGAVLSSSSSAVASARKALADAEARALDARQAAAAAQSGTGFNFGSGADVLSFINTRRGALENIEAERKGFDQNNGQRIDDLRRDALYRFASFQSRNRAYAFDSATSAVKDNTEERGIRDELANRITGNGQGPRVFKELADSAGYISGAITTTQGTVTLLRDLAKVTGANTDQLQEIAKQVAEINARSKNTRGLQ